MQRRNDIAGLFARADSRAKVSSSLRAGVAMFGGLARDQILQILVLFQVQAGGRG